MPRLPPNAYSNSYSGRQCLWCCHRGTVTARVHPVHLTNVARAPTTGPSQSASTTYLPNGSDSTTFTIAIYY